VSLGAKTASAALLTAALTAGTAVAVSPAGSGSTCPPTVPLNGKPGPLLVAGRTLWVGVHGTQAGRPGRLLKLDARTGRLRGSFPLPTRHSRCFGKPSY
jgi:hypothetical protein